MSRRTYSKTYRRLQTRIELCRTRARSFARRSARKLVTINWSNDYESLLPQLHYIFLALVLIGGIAWNAEA